MTEPSEHPGPPDEPYQGPVGETRLDSVEIPKPGGGSRVVQVYRSIDAADRPDLADLALAGRLHVLPDGEALAVSFVYHDPAARRFALVLPEALRDSEYGERSALLAQLAADQEHPIPGYVRDFAILVGVQELAFYLERPNRAERLDARERALDERERALDEREDELASCEGTVSREAPTPPAEPAVEESDGIDDDIDDPDDPPLSDFDVSPDPELDSDDPPLSDFDVSPDPELDPVSSVRAVSEFETDHLADSTLREPEPTAFVERRPRRPLPRASKLTPPAGLSARLDDAGLCLRLSLAPGRELFFAGGGDLRVQFAPTEGHPIVLLTLVERRDESLGAGHVSRLVLDPFAPEARAQLESLRARFAARLEIIDADGGVVRELELLSPRHTNVAMILSRVDKLGRSEEGIDIGWIRDRVIASPPPIDSDDHPFHREGGAAGAREAADAVRLLGRWSQPAQLETALLVLSIPHEVVDDSFRRILADAIEHGIALPTRLVDRAVELGVAEDETSLVKRAVDAFRGTSMSGDRGGLVVEEIALNWQRLFEMAHEHSVDIDADVLAAAKVDVSRGRMGGAAMIDLSTMPNMEIEELIRLLEHPEVRADAAIELLGRRDPYVLDPVCASLRSMGRRDISRVVPRMVPMGGVAGQKLIKGLSAQKPFARQAALLALGELRHRPAIEPILHLLRHEPGDVWEEAARVLSVFGKEGFRALRRGLGDLLGPEERFAEALAHFMDAGLQEEVLRMQQDENRYLAQVAEAAVGRLAAAREKAGVARDERPCSSSDVLRAFSQHFYRQLGHAVAPPPV